MLKHVAPGAKEPAAVTVFSKPGCPFCLEAKALLKEKGFTYEEISLDSGISYKTLRNVTGQNTAPQIYLDGQHINGLDGLRKHFDQG